MTFNLIVAMPSFWLILLMFCSLITVAGIVITMFGMQSLYESIFIFGIVLMCIGIGTGMWCVDHRPYDTTPAYSWDVTTIQNITSLSNDDAFGISGKGSFTLGSGTSMVGGNTRQIYTFFKVLPEGYQRGTIDAENVIISEDEQTFPYIEWNYRHTKSERRVYLDNGDSFGGIQTDVLVSTYIHVPKNTVVKEYKI